MTQETSNGKLNVLLIILSIAIVVMAAGLYSFVVSVTFSPEQRSLSVSADASTYVIPDTASISLGVITQEGTAKEASDKNAASMNAVISELKNLGLMDKDIRTSFLSIQPVYNYSSDPPAIVGYAASNNVQITTKMIERISDIIDKSVSAGANQVDGISFTVSEEKQKQIRDELLSTAVNEAQNKANNLAKGLNVKIVDVKTVSISEGSEFPMISAVAEKAATPIQPGESKVTLTIHVTYIIE